MRVQIDGVDYLPKAQLLAGDYTLPVMLKTLRKNIGYTLGGLAEQTGLSKSYLWGLEHGENEPSLRTAAKLAEVLGVPIERLAAALTHNEPTQGRP